MVIQQGFFVLFKFGLLSFDFIICTLTSLFDLFFDFIFFFEWALEKKDIIFMSPADFSGQSAQKGRVDLFPNFELDQRGRKKKC